MKTIYLILISFQALLLLSLSSMNSFAQTTPGDAIVYTIANDVQVNSKVLEFDLLLWDSVFTEQYELSIVQGGITVNSNIYNGGTITASIVAGSSALVAAQQPSAITFTQSSNVIKLAGKAPPGCGNGTIISQDPSNRTRICRIMLTNTADFTPNSTANLTFNFSTFPYATKCARYAWTPTCTNIASPMSSSNVYSMASNIILNPASICPYLFNVTGGGNYCEGSPGKVVGLSGSEIGVEYTLYKDWIAAMTPVTGTGYAISFGIQVAGNYTVMGVNTYCPAGVFMTGTAVVTQSPIVTPTFGTFGPYCQGTAGVSLPTTSLNGITGTWTPPIVNTSVVGTTGYTFTPASSQCAAPVTVNITLNPFETPTFPVFGPYCQGDSSIALPTVSLNGIIGTWTPPTVNTAIAGDAQYLFTPTTGECTLNSTVVITVLSKIVPTFLPIGPFCQYAIPPALPEISLNGVQGTWTPSVINTSVIGVSTYTFTPSSGECTEQSILQIEIGSSVTAIFAPIGPLCQNSSPPALPATSLNGFTGIWSPSTINTTSVGIFTYLFTPDAGQCSNSGHLTIEIISSPGAAGPISGPVNVNVGDTAVYSIDPLLNVYNYYWAYSGSNYQVIEGYNTNFIKLCFLPGATSGILSVFGINSCGAGASSNLAINASSPCYFTTWTGQVNNDWSNPGNWDCSIPDSFSHVTIPGGCPNYPLITGSKDPCISIHQLIIQDGGELIGQQYLCPANQTIVRHIIADTNFHFLSSPVLSNGSFEGAFPWYALNDIYVRTYDEPTGDWWNVVGTDIPVSGKGYSLQMITAPHEATFAGPMNSGDLTRPLSNVNPSSDLSRVGWNLLGNPFTSAIDWDLFTAGDFDAQVAIWDETIGGYRYWNHTIGNLPDGIIPSWNGFFVRTSNPGGATITIPIASQVFSNHGFYKRTDVSDVLDVKVEGNGYQDETFIHLNEAATIDFDGQFDAFKLWGYYYVPQVFSITPEYYLSIDVRPLDVAVPVYLGIYCDLDGAFKLTVGGIETFNPGTPLWLEDLKLGIHQDLRINPVYNFDYTQTDSENRFRLYFKAPISVPENPLNEISVYSVDKSIIIKNPTDFSGNVIVFDFSGRALLQTHMNRQTELIVPARYAVGGYIVRIQTSEFVISHKVIID